MDPSENACIEVLRPKTVPEGLIALGTVVNISNIQLKLQITGGIVCLVELGNVNRVYSNLLERSQNKPGKLLKLNDFFEIGQQYVCKIIGKRARKGYSEAQDILATLDPSEIQEDNLPKTLLAIPQAPLQCVVQSIEDHGYQIDIGFKGLTGFLSFKDSTERRLSVGQIIRCCSKDAVTLTSDTKVVNLTLSKELIKKSKFSKDKIEKHTITERCVLPGSKSFLTVMKVVKNGLVVNFMNEFAGFVGPQHLKDEWHDAKTNYKVSEKFTCTVLYYNHITRTFALSIRKSSTFKKTLSNLIENYHCGKYLNAKVSHINGMSSVVFKVEKSLKAVANVKDALNQDTGTMTKDEILTELDSTFPENSQHKCRIKTLNLADLLIVVSLKEDYMKLPYASIEELKPADIIEVTVKKYVKDGIVVEFGFNLRAIILNKDLESTYKIYPIGKKIKARVLKIDDSKQPNRVYLTNRTELMDPNMTIVCAIDKSFKGKSTYATVYRVRPDGLIVELFNNVKGFIPKRFLTTTSLSKVEDIFKIGQVVSCVVYSVNLKRNSLNLGIVTIEKIIEAKKENRLAKKSRKEAKKIERIEENIANKLGKSLKRVRKSVEESEEPEEQVEPELAPPLTKSRRIRSEEAKQREEVLREAERALMDPNRPPQSILDFEGLVLRSPNSADAWIKYSSFMIDNIETEKARIICRRALKTINFREEKEKLKIWLHLIKIEAKYGGVEKLRKTLKEAEATSDKLRLYQGAAKVLTSCNELDEAKNLHQMLLKNHSKMPEIWLDCISFHMEHRKDLEEARNLYGKGCKSIDKSDLVNFKSRFAQFEFRFGDVERGKTLFDSILSDNPKRVDLWTVYKAMVQKFGTRQIDNDEVREQNQQLLQRITESIELVSRKKKK